MAKWLNTAGEHCLSVLVTQPRRLFPSPWTVARQAPLSMEFSRQDYWSGLPFSSPGYLPNSGIESGSPALQVDSLPSELQGKPCTTIYIRATVNS